MKGGGEDGDDTLNFDLPPLGNILELDEIPELMETPNIEDLPYFHVVSDPEGAPAVQDDLGDDLSYDFEDESDFEDEDHLDLAEVPYLDVVPNNEDTDSDADEIPGSSEEPTVAASTAGPGDNKEGVSNRPNASRPFFRLPREKKGKSGIRFFP